MSKRKFSPKKLLAFDCETTGLDPWHGDAPFCIAMCDEDENTLCYEFDVDPFTRRVIPNQSALEHTQELLSRPGLLKGGHNVKFDIRMLERAFNIQVEGPLFDSMFAAHAFCSHERGTLGLKWQCENRLKYLGPSKESVQLLELVKRLRRQVGKLGWRIAYAEDCKADGQVKRKAQPEADLWLPRAAYQAGLIAEGHTWCREYASCDAIGSKRLFEYYRYGFENVEEYAGAYKAYQEEMELWPITYAMETHGIRVDLARTEALIRHYKQKRSEALGQLHAVAGKDFNPNSHPQVVRLWRDVLKLPIEVTTDAGSPSISFSVIRKHAHHETVTALCQFRAWSKLLTTYLLRYKKLAVPRGRIHTLHCNYRQVGTATRRYSCAEPNLQNIADASEARTVQPIQARGPLGPRPGNVWVHFDYDQLEARIFACFANEEFMLEAYRKGRDLHTECANKAYGGITLAAIRAAEQALDLHQDKPSSPLVEEQWRRYDVAKAQRRHPIDLLRIAKKWLLEYDGDIVAAEKSLNKKTSRNRAKLVFYAKIFAGGPGAVNKVLEVTWDEASKFFADYDVAFPSIARYIRQAIIDARQSGCVYTPWGHRITVDTDYAYTAVNYRVQGTAAVHLKRAMIRVTDYVHSIGYNAQLVMTVHDELVWEIPRDDIRIGVLRKFQAIMEEHENAFAIDLPTTMAITTDGWDGKRKTALGSKCSRVKIGELT